MIHRGILSYEKEYGNLQIIHEHLPIQSLDLDYPIIETEKYIVLFNGEIFDHDKKDDLEYLKEVFENSKNIFNAIEEIKYKDGFYSFIVLDKEENKVYAFTDPLGKKQLYYSKGSGIASEIRGLNSIKKFDHTYFGTILKWGYNTDDRTPFISVKRILPNKIYTFNIEIELRGIKNDYFDFFTDRTFYGSPRDIIYYTLEKATQNRLIGHKKIALLLSGGLDSSIINHHLSNADVVSYTVENQEDIEFALQLRPDAKRIKFDQFDFKDPMLAMEMPVDLGSMIPQYNLCKNISETVIITGDGADELFGGYKRIAEYDSQVSDVFDELSYYHLIRLDRMSMYFTKELRSPFLNLDLVRFALCLPREDRMNKKILKETYSGILPDEIINRKKTALKINRCAQDPYGYRKEMINWFMKGKING